MPQTPARRARWPVEHPPPDAGKGFSVDWLDGFGELDGVHKDAATRWVVVVAVEQTTAQVVRVTPSLRVCISPAPTSRPVPEMRHEQTGS